MPPSTARTESFGLPPIPMWLRNLLIGLCALYLFEVVLVNLLGWPTGNGQLVYQWVAWFDLTEGPWQILTRYLVQGLGRNAVFRLVFDLLLLYFLAPTVVAAFDLRQRGQLLAAVVIGGTVMAGLLGALGLAQPPALGWHGLSVAMITLFGLTNPEGVIRWNFLFPIPGRVIAWGTGVINLLVLLGDRSMIAADDFGVWAGVMVWFHLLGPGARRRRLLQQSQKIERDLRNFQVLPGGRDETFH